MLKLALAPTPSLPPAAPLPAIVVTVPPARALTVLHKKSATKSVGEEKARPTGPVKVALKAAPLEQPAAPEPAAMLTAPAGVTSAMYKLELWET